MRPRPRRPRSGPTAIRAARLCDAIAQITQTSHIQLVAAPVVLAETRNALSPRCRSILRDLAVENG
jgi:hypothetical protein